MRVLLPGEPRSRNRFPFTYAWRMTQREPDPPQPVPEASPAEAPVGAGLAPVFDPDEGRRVFDLDRRHVIHSWSVQSQISPLPIAGGRGSYFWDYHGRRYLDFGSQVVNASLGHGHPRIVAAIKEQAGELCVAAPAFANAKRSELARLLAEVTPGDLTMSFFTNGGAEANENAIKIARLHTGRHKILARYRSYHGATAGAIALTGDPRRWPAEPGIPGVVHILDPYTYRCPVGHPDPCPVCSGAPYLEEVLQYEGPRDRGRRRARDRDGHERRHRAAPRLSAFGARGVRPARHPADPRRGDDRLRPHRPLVRLPSTGMSCPTS